MALNLVPVQEYSRGGYKFNRDNNFKSIFKGEEYKTRTIMEYFKYTFSNQFSNETFTIRRESVHGQIADIIK